MGPRFVPVMGFSFCPMYFILKVFGQVCPGHLKKSMTFSEKWAAGGVFSD
jgi:hypothetical protein